MYIYEMRYVWLYAFISQVDPIRFLKWNFVDVRMAHDTRGWYIFMICARLHGEPRRSQSKPVVTVYLQCVPLQSVSTPAHKFSCHWRCGHFIRFFPPALLELWTSIWKPYAMNVISKSICIKKVERSWEKNIWHKPNTFASATPPVLLYKYIYVCVCGDWCTFQKIINFDLHTAWIQIHPSVVRLAAYRENMFAGRIDTTHADRKCTSADSKWMWAWPSAFANVRACAQGRWAFYSSAGAVGMTLLDYAYS